VDGNRGYAVRSTKAIQPQNKTKQVIPINPSLGVVRLVGLGWVFGRSVRGWTILRRGRHAVVVV